MVVAHVTGFVGRVEEGICDLTLTCCHVPALHSADEAVPEPLRPLVLFLTSPVVVMLGAAVFLIVIALTLRPADEFSNMSEEERRALDDRARGRSRGARGRGAKDAEDEADEEDDAGDEGEEEEYEEGDEYEDDEAVGDDDEDDDVDDEGEGDDDGGEDDDHGSAKRDASTDKFHTD